MSVNEIVSLCIQRNISLKLGQNDALDVYAEEGSLTDDLVELIRRRKPDIINWLINQQSQRNFPLANRAQNQKVVGDAPLLANHHWFIQRLTPNHWNKSVLLKLIPDFSPALLRKALSAVIEHHDALRMIFATSNGVLVQRFQAELSEETWWYRHDLSQLNDSEASRRVESLCAEYQGSLNIYECLFKVVYFDLGSGRSPRLLFAIHGLLTDAIAGPILLEDIFLLYGSIRNGDKAVLPSKTDSLKQWAEWQRNYANTQALDYLPYWRSRPWNSYVNLPEEEDKNSLLPDNGSTTAKFVHGSLSASDTQRLTLAAKRTGFSINDFLVTALVQAYAQWSGSAVLFLLFVHNGRVIRSDPSIDLSRTVGWLPNYCNIVLDLRGFESPRCGLSAVKRIKEQYSALQDDGLSYSCLRYMTADEKVRSEMARLPGFQMEFNYDPATTATLGSSQAERFASPAHEDPGPNDGPMHSKFPPFGKAMQKTDYLTLYWGYCPTQYTAKTMQRFLDKQVSNLLTLTDTVLNVSKSENGVEATS